MNANEIFDTGEAIARFADVRVVGGTRLMVVWADGPRKGRSEEVDVGPVVGSYKAYRDLRDAPERFSTLRLVDDGYAVAWDGVEAEMTAELVCECAEESMDCDEFAAFLRRNRLTQDAAAALLGRSRRQIANYVKAGPIPRIVALACFGYEALAARRRADAA